MATDAVAVAVAADGRRLARALTVKNDATLVSALLTWIRTAAGDAPVTWAIEDGRGFAGDLADGLLPATRWSGSPPA